jgi:hypothetical protein
VVRESIYPSVEASGQQAARARETVLEILAGVPVRRARWSPYTLKGMARRPPRLAAARPCSSIGVSHELEGFAYRVVVRASTDLRGRFAGEAVIEPARTEPLGYRVREWTVAPSDVAPPADASSKNRQSCLQVLL